MVNLEIILDMDKPFTLYYDNNEVVINAKEPRSHKIGEHIE